MFRDTFYYDLILLIISEIIFGLIMWFLFQNFGHKLAISQSKKQEIQVLNNFYQNYVKKNLDDLFYDLKYMSDSDEKVLFRTLLVRKKKSPHATSIELHLKNYRLILSPKREDWKLCRKTPDSEICYSFGRSIPDQNNQKYHKEFINYVENQCNYYNIPLSKSNK